MALGFLLVQYAPAQARGDTDDAVQRVTANETLPFTGQIELILCRHDIGRGAVYAILVEKQSGDFMPTGKDSLGETQGAPRSRGVGG